MALMISTKRPADCPACFDVIMINVDSWQALDHTLAFLGAPGAGAENRGTNDAVPAQSHGPKRKPVGRAFKSSHVTKAGFLDADHILVTRSAFARHRGSESEGAGGGASSSSNQDVGARRSVDVEAAGDFDSGGGGSAGDGGDGVVDGAHVLSEATRRRLCLLYTPYQARLAALLGVKTSAIPFVPCAASTGTGQGAGASPAANTILPRDLQPTAGRTGPGTSAREFGHDPVSPGAGAVSQGQLQALTGGRVVDGVTREFTLRYGRPFPPDTPCLEDNGLYFGKGRLPRCARPCQS